MLIFSCYCFAVICLFVTSHRKERALPSILRQTGKSTRCWFSHTQKRCLSANQRVALRQTAPTAHLFFAQHMRFSEGMRSSLSSLRSTSSSLPSRILSVFLFVFSWTTMAGLSQMVVAVAWWCSIAAGSAIDGVGSCWRSRHCHSLCLPPAVSCSDWMSEGARKMATAGRLAAGTGSGAAEREAVATNADSTHPRCGSVKEKT